MHMGIAGYGEWTTSIGGVTVAPNFRFSIQTSC